MPKRAVLSEQRAPRSFGIQLAESLVDFVPFLRGDFIANRRRQAGADGARRLPQLVYVSVGVLDAPVGIRAPESASRTASEPDCQPSAEFHEHVLRWNARHEIDPHRQLYAIGSVPPKAWQPRERKELRNNASERSGILTQDSRQSPYKWPPILRAESLPSIDGARFCPSNARLRRFRNQTCDRAHLGMSFADVTAAARPRKRLAAVGGRGAGSLERGTPGRRIFQHSTRTNSMKRKWRRQLFRSRR